MLFNNIDFDNLDKPVNKLNRTRYQVISEREKIISSAISSGKLRETYRQIVKNEFNNIDFPTKALRNLADGISLKDLACDKQANFSNGIVAICLYSNASAFIDKWFQHYIDLGVNNFVMVDCGSTDSTTQKIRIHTSEVNIVLWHSDRQYNCEWACGVRQGIMEFYGTNRWYLNVDADELLIYKGYKKLKLNHILGNDHISQAPAMTLDVYTSKPLADGGELSDYHFIDESTHYKTTYDQHGLRIYGGPLERVLNIAPSLQRYPLTYYTGHEALVNKNYYYPYTNNETSPVLFYLLSYKLMNYHDKITRPDTHWDDPNEYRCYMEALRKDPKLSFYDPEVSIDINKYL
ncbi:MAG: glycosyltransferase family 2 protein [Candidatus Saccharibacteria bacterium]|nr:glycosyltransferase family 2 protein [Candidatus Saccharibacteria bacterium]